MRTPASFSRGVGFALVAGALVLVSLPPAGVPQDYSSLDGDWSFALHEIFAQKLQFGTDVTFTYGPWGFLLFRFGHPLTSLVFFLGNFVIWGAVFSVWWRVTAPVPSPIARAVIGVLVTVTGASGITDGLIYATAASIPLIPLLRGERASLAADLAIGIGVAVLCWTKFTFLITFSAAIIILAYHSLYARRFPRLAAIWLICLPLAWFASGQRLDGILPYLNWSLHIAREYGGALGASNSGAAATAVHAAALLLLSALLIRHISKVTQSRGQLVLVTVWLIGCSLLVMKASFIRHDEEHQVIAAAYLLYLTVVSASILRPANLREYGVLSAGAVTAALMGAVGLSGGSFAPVDMLRLSRFLRSSVADAGAHISGAKIPPELPCEMPALTADSYSTGQTLVIHSRAGYLPRPTIQSYAAFSPQLARLNRQRLIAASPEQVLFSVEPIDGRFPHHEDGVSWPVLWQRYRPTGMTCVGFVQLRLLSRAPVLRQGPVLMARGVGRLGEWIPRTFARGGSAVLRIRVRPSVPGRIMAAVLRTPALRLRVDLDDGTGREYRVLGGLLADGVLIEPLIESTEDFVIAGWGDPSRLPRMVRFRLESEPLPFSGWAQRFEWELMGEADSASDLEAMENGDPAQYRP